MVDEPILDTNDQYLTGMFLREMIRFEKFVRAQGTTDATVRIGKAYARALMKFVAQQKRSGK